MKGKLDYHLLNFLLLCHFCRNDMYTLHYYTQQYAFHENSIM